jgi:hypothetical protein
VTAASPVHQRQFKGDGLPSPWFYQRTRVRKDAEGDCMAEITRQRSGELVRGVFEIFGGIQTACPRSRS